MFVEVSIVLAWSESSVLFLDKEEGSSLGRVGGVDFSSTKVFVEKCFSGKAFIGGERVEFSYFRGKGVGEVYFMIIGSRGRDMVGSFFGKYRGELEVFEGKDSLGLCCFGGGGEFSTVAAVRRAITGDPIGIKWELHRMIRWRVLFSQARLI